MANSESSNHEFKPDEKEPLHCAVCWQYRAWWQHKLPVSTEEAAEKLRSIGIKETYAPSPAPESRKPYDAYTATCTVCGAIAKPGGKCESCGSTDLKASVESAPLPEEGGQELKFDRVSSDYCIELTIPQMKKLLHMESVNNPDAVPYEEQLDQQLVRVDGVTCIEYEGHFGAAVYLKIEHDLDIEATHAAVRNIINNHLQRGESHGK